VRGRHLTTGVTLLVLVALLVAGGIYGLDSLLRPLPQDKSSAASTCSATDVKKGQRLHTRQVEVSVFNAGNRSGLAGEVMVALHQRGFRQGDVGNAPAGSGVKRAQVWTTQRNDAAARLVLRQFKKGIAIHVVKADLGPGVDVVIGSDFRKLAKPTRVLVVQKASAACLRQGARQVARQGAQQGRG